MKIISERRTVEGVEYSLGFEWVGTPGAGFSFACDKDGNIDVEAMPATARGNYEMCLANPGGELRATGVETREWSYREPAIGKCECGREVALEGFTNTCDCGRDYNMSGQMLAPRAQWGEETGETWQDCMF